MLTVAIPFYNAGGCLPYAIESTLRQTYADFELLLVDDGSTDNSLDVARSYSDDPRVRVISDGRNLGLAPRLNQIAQLASRPYLARMDADDVMLPDRLRLQLAYLESHAAVDVLGTGKYLIDEKYRILGARTAEPRIRLCHRFSYLHLFHPTVMGRREWFRSNPYSDGFPRCEDGELWIRAGGGPNIAHLPERLLFYNRYVQFDPAKTARSLEQYERMLVVHRGRMCHPCFVRSLLAVRAKRLALPVLARFKQLGLALDQNTEPAPPAEAAAAAAILDAIRNAALTRTRAAART